jgi:uncharacterized protein YjbI with pentapeptide repeats
MDRKKPGRKKSQEPKKESRWGFRGMTVRDWLQLLIVPFVLTVIGFVFTIQQDARQQAIENQRAQDAALQSYFDQMSSLMIGENQLRDSEKDSEIRTVARARTLTVLRMLDESRKPAVMLFLREAMLVQRVEGRGPIISLSGADLRGVDLNAVDLRGATLYGADLRGADMISANLSDADLSGADLSDVDLFYADLSGANLEEAELSGANLEAADLSGATGITKEELERQAASLEGATMPDGSTHP